jgi:hypothetical protein
MNYHEDMRNRHKRERIAAEMGGGMASPQVTDRWLSCLRLGLSRTKFRSAERHDCLHASMSQLGNWTGITARVGDGQSRPSAQAKSLVNTLHTKLERFHINLRHLDTVDSLPDSVFPIGSPPSDNSSRWTPPRTWIH